MSEKVIKSDKEWAAMLTPMQYKVTRKHGTEPAFTGEYHDSKEPGTYNCICCGNPLFDSATNHVPFRPYSTIAAAKPLQNFLAS